MPDYEVPEPILKPPSEESAWHWNIEEGKEPEKRAGRREAGYFYRDPKASPADGDHEALGARKVAPVSVAKRDAHRERSQFFLRLVNPSLIWPRKLAQQIACDNKLHYLRGAVANLEADHVAHPLLMR